MKYVVGEIDTIVAIKFLKQGLTVRLDDCMAVGCVGVSQQVERGLCIAGGRLGWDCTFTAAILGSYIVLLPHKVGEKTTKDVSNRLFFSTSRITGFLLSRWSLRTVSMVSRKVVEIGLVRASNMVEFCAVAGQQLA